MIPNVESFSGLRPEPTRRQMYISQRAVSCVVSVSSVASSRVSPSCTAPSSDLAQQRRSSKWRRMIRRCARQNSVTAPGPVPGSRPSADRCDGRPSSRYGGSTDTRGRGAGSSRTSSTRFERNYSASTRCPRVDAPCSSRSQTVKATAVKDDRLHVGVKSHAQNRKHHHGVVTDTDELVDRRLQPGTGPFEEHRTRLGGHRG